MISKGKRTKLREFPVFYTRLLDEMKNQAQLQKEFKVPDKKILLTAFQKHLQQASAEGPSLEARNDFLVKAYRYYLKTGKIIGDKDE